jgi:GH24 family phage-related lysozyme (muramidase)
MPPTFDAIKQLIAPSEGSKSFMYLDTKGLVTVGIGNMLPSAAAACALAFVDRATQARASSAAIEADYQAVSQQSKAKVANFYRQFTKLDLPDAEIDRLFAQRVAGFQNELRSKYAAYDTFPDSAQLAMLDMAFNLGTFALKNKWPKLNAAIDSGDWSAAATECIRPEANAARNAATVALFQQAAAAAA